jgi:hypothetical protein
MFGIPPGTFAIYGAAAAVGLKNTVQSLATAVRANNISDRANRRAMEDSAATRHQLEKKCRQLIEETKRISVEDNTPYSSESRELRRAEIVADMEADLHMFNEGFSKQEELEQSFERNRQKFRELVLAAKLEEAKHSSLGDRD